MLYLQVTDAAVTVEYENYIWSKLQPCYTNIIEQTGRGNGERRGNHNSDGHRTVRGPQLNPPKGLHSLS